MIRLALLVSAVAVAPWRAVADSRTIVSLGGVGRVGPAGIMLSAGVARRWLQDDGPSSLAQGRYFQLGLAAGANPAYAQGSVAAEWVPIAPLQLRLQYDGFGFFGANGSLLRFPSASSKFGKAEIDALSRQEESGLGHRVMLNPVLRARFGRVVLRNESEVSWYRMSSRTGWYYEWEHDTLVGESDWLVANRTTAFVELWRGANEATLLVGPMYDVTRAGGAHITRHRVGAAAYFEPAGRSLGFDPGALLRHGGRERRRSQPPGRTVCDLRPRGRHRFRPSRSALRAAPLASRRTEQGGPTQGRVFIPFFISAAKSSGAPGKTFVMMGSYGASSPAACSSPRTRRSQAPLHLRDGVAQPERRTGIQAPCQMRRASAIQNLEAVQRKAA